MDKYFEKILDFVKAKRGLDFSQYRKNLLSRRVLVRLRATKHNTNEEYLAYLTRHPVELDELMNALTINVTEFFRDAKVFDVIEKKVIPEIINKKPVTSDQQPATIRIWSCASSSGEEAYSILMLIAEHLGKKLSNYDLTIYGTDIDNQALAKAREAVYEKSQFRNLSEERKAIVDKYFYNMDNDRFWIREEWPAYMHFKYRDVITDTPLENMDMILCRNLFIYFDRNLQQQVLERFWRSLNPGGFLILGNVETMFGPVREKFIEYDREAKIYVKK